MYPYRLAGGDLVTGDDLVFAALLLRVEIIATNGEGRPARSDRPAPQFGRRRRGPIGVDSHIANDAVSIASAKTGPLRRHFRRPRGRFRLCCSRSDRRCLPRAQPAHWVWRQRFLPTLAAGVRRSFAPGAAPRQLASTAISAAKRRRRSRRRSATSVNTAQARTMDTTIGTHRRVATRQPAAAPTSARPSTGAMYAGRTKPIPAAMDG